MTKEELKNVLNYVAMAYTPGKFGYPTESVELNKMKARVWYDLLGLYDYGEVMQAIRLYISEGDAWPPTPGQILATIEKMYEQARGILTAGEAYELAVGAARKYGTYDPEKARQSLPPEVWAAIEHIGGYKTLCMSQEGDTFLMSLFARTYEEVKTKMAFRQKVELLQAQSQLLLE